MPPRKTPVYRANSLSEQPSVIILYTATTNRHEAVEDEKVPLYEVHLVLERNEMSSHPDEDLDARLVGFPSSNQPVSDPHLSTTDSYLAQLATSIARGNVPPASFSGPDSSLSLPGVVSNTDHLLALRSLQRNREEQLLLERYLLSQQSAPMSYADRFQVTSSGFGTSAAGLFDVAPPVQRLSNLNQDALLGLLPVRLPPTSLNSLLQELLTRRSNDIFQPSQDYRILLELQNIAANSARGYASSHESPLSARLDLHAIGTNSDGIMHSSNPPTDASSYSRLVQQHPQLVVPNSRTEGGTDIDTSLSGGDSVSSHDELPWDDIIRGGVLTSTDLRGAVSDVHFAVMAQMKPCVLTYEDRVGLYKARDIGCRGMCCKHCGGVPGFGRYFPGSFSSLVNGNICKSIVKHLLEECRACPANIREFVTKMERNESLVPFHYQRGSRRQFFALVWNQIHEGHPKAGDVSIDGSSDNRALDPGASIVLPASIVNDDRSSIPWAKILENSTVVHMSDRHLVPDTIFAATAQTKPCEITEGDRVGRCKDHRIGSMGLCCRHCEGKPGAFGRYFPSNLHTFAQVEVCKQIVKHIVTGKCHSCPPEIRDSILQLQQIENALPSKRYPSRMVFFRRVWHRFHSTDGNESSDGIENPEFVENTVTIETEAVNIPWEELIKDSTLVTAEDHGLISDSQFVAISQMDPCQLKEEDRIGYNKHRNIGFIGMACRHCGGRPGFGRYFPNTVRNFEKTSARDTIVSHVTMFCQKCPEDIRNAMLTLKRIESSHTGSATMKGLVYGSGKLFFRRIWSRLHGNDGSTNDADDVLPKEKHSSSCRGANLASDESDDDTLDGKADVCEGNARGKKRERAISGSSGISKRSRQS
jgi:hypothetical protein